MSDICVLALIYFDKVATIRSQEQLTWTPDLLMGICDHFIPLGDPASGAGQGEQNREHAGRESDRLQNDA